METSMRMGTGRPGSN